MMILIILYIYTTTAYQHRPFSSKATLSPPKKEMANKSPISSSTFIWTFDGSWLFQSQQAESPRAAFSIWKPRKVGKDDGKKNPWDVTMIGFFEIRNSSEGFLKAILLFCFVFFLRVFLLLGFFRARNGGKSRIWTSSFPFFRGYYILIGKNHQPKPQTCWKKKLLQTGKAQTKHKDLVSAQLEGLVWFRRHSLVLYIHLLGWRNHKFPTQPFCLRRKKGNVKNNITCIIKKGNGT